MDIAVSINKCFLQHFHAMLTSLLTNTCAKSITLHILNSDLDYDDQELIIENFKQYDNLKIKFYRINATDFQDIDIVFEHLTVEALYRLCLPRLLPKDIEKVLYLDSDMIILSDILELYNTDITNYYLAACNEYHPYFSANLDLKSAKDYFNSGLLLMNIKKCREDNFEQICLTFAKETKKIMYCLDQDILNGVLQGNWLRLDLSWNVVRSIFEQTELYESVYRKEYIQKCIKKPKIIHYTTFSKPWHYLDNHPYKDAYMKYLKLSKWKPKKSYEKDILEKSNIYIFGASLGAKKILEILEGKVKIKGLIDNDEKKVNQIIYGYKVFSPFNYNQRDIVIIGSSYIKEISKQLEDLGFVKDYSYFTSISSFYSQLYNNQYKIKKLLEI